MIRVEKLVVGQLQANCYLIYDDKTRECIIIDPGDEAEYIIQKITDLDLKPKFIVATHAHFDHVQAATELKLAYKIPFLIHAKDSLLLKHYRKSALHFTKVDPGPAPQPDSYLVENSKLEILNSKFEVIHTPGHTAGGICIYFPKEEILFSGDTIFANGEVGRTDYSYCSKTDLKKSINNLLKLPQQTIVYPGHGEKTTIGNFSQVLGLHETLLINKEV
jgi:hydroxyacylglutathione hydrolase